MNVNQIIRILRPLLRRRGKSQKWVLLTIGLLIGYSFLQPHLNSQFGWRLPILNSRGGHSRGAAVGTTAIIEAFEKQRSDVMVQCDLEVIKLLRDDYQGDRHQKMLLRLPASNHTVLLAHNIDLAERVPANVGDTITVRGEYEFNDEGGVLHWTHHDPRGRHPAGWIEHRGERYE